jgi:branched-chain amino acid transport system substrate-binding protein
VTRSKKMSGRSLVLAAAVALAVGIGACGSSSSSSSNSAGASSSSSSSGSASNASSGGAPIPVGSITAITGPFSLTDASNGAKALFDRVNAEGGINGRKINFIIADDKTDPATSATVARQLIQQDNVVVLTGDVSLVSCAVNQALLQQADVRDVMAGGAIPQCFNQPNISPVNAGPETDLLLSSKFVTGTLNLKNICAFLTDSPPTKGYLSQLKTQAAQLMGAPFAHIDTSITQNTNYASLMIEAKNDKCGAILNDGSPPQAIPLAAARSQQGVTAPLVLQGASYVADLPKALGPSAKNIYAVSEMEPYTLSTPVLQPMLADFTKYGVKVTSLAQYGWESANIVVQVLKSIKGPITRSSVNNALLALTSLDTGGMTGSPYSFGPGKTHNPNRSAKLVQDVNGKWVAATGWVTLPPLSGS